MLAHRIDRFAVSSFAVFSGKTLRSAAASPAFAAGDEVAVQSPQVSDPRWSSCATAGRVADGSKISPAR
jgi:hypothetical protein